MDLLLISNIMVAGGTLALAYYAYKNIKSSEEQLKFLRKQTKIFTSQQEPYILVQNKEFKGNKIELILSNQGGGPAFEVAVETKFFIVEVKITSESKKLLKETPINNWDKLNIQGIHDFIPNKPLLLEKNKDDIKTDIFTTIRSKILKMPINYDIVFPSSATTFIFDIENEQSILKPGEKDKFFEFEPYFFVTTDKLEEGITGTIGKAFLFDELKDFLLRNNIQYIGITLDLVSRDKIGKVHGHQEIDSCIVYLNENKTLEEAFNSGRKVTFTTLGWLEIQKKNKWLPSFLYNKIELERDTEV